MLKHGGDTKKAKQLADLEMEYRYLAKNNPTSYNAARENNKKLEKCVSSMRRLRRQRSIRHDGMGWLQEILDRAPTQ